MTDLIDTLAGIAPGSALDKARDNRPEARKHAQTSYDALFSPKDFGGFSAIERFAVAAFVAGLHGRPETKDYYAGLVYAIGASERHTLGPRLSTAFEHTHMLVLHPRDAAPPSLQALLDAGWSTTDIVTLSQLVSFLSFQIRVVAGLKAMNA